VKKQSLTIEYSFKAQIPPLVRDEYNKSSISIIAKSKPESIDKDFSKKDKISKSPEKKCSKS